MKKRLSDGKRTGAFRKWCKTRPGIMVGNKEFEDWRVQARKEAKAHLSAILVNIAKFKDDLEQHASRYTTEELRVIRAGEPLSPPKFLNASLASSTFVTAASTSDFLKPSRLQNKAIARLRNFPDRP